MKKSFKLHAAPLGAVGLLVAGVMASTGASALSFSNPDSAVSSGDTPFSLSCEFDNYRAVGTYSVAEKMSALPQEQMFHFDGSDVKNDDGSLGGYVFANSETRRDWRMETGAPGSAIYRFTHFKGSNQIVANIDIIDGKAFHRLDVPMSGPAAQKAETKAADAISLRESLKAGATKTMKDAYAAQTIVLAKALKDAKANTKAADAADEAALDEARTAVPDIHMIRGNCRRQAAS